MNYSDMKANRFHCAISQTLQQATLRVRQIANDDTWRARDKGDVELGLRYLAGRRGMPQTARCKGAWTDPGHH